MIAAESMSWGVASRCERRDPRVRTRPGQLFAAASSSRFRQGDPSAFGSFDQLAFRSSES